MQFFGAIAAKRLEPFGLFGQQAAAIATAIGKTGRIADAEDGVQTELLKEAMQCSASPALALSCTVVGAKNPIRHDSRRR